MSIQLIQQYHANVEKMIRYGGSRNESALRKPFQDLLEAYAAGKNLLLVLERYKERTPKDPTICDKFNTYRFADYKERVIDLIGRVCAVSVETMKIIQEMP